MKITSFSMSRLCTMPGIDLLAPIKTDDDDYQGEVFIPKELHPFNASNLPATNWWVSPPVKPPYVKKEVGFDKSLLFVCNALSNAGFGIRFNWDSHNKSPSNIQIEFSGITSQFLVTTKVTIDDLVKFLTFSKKDSWIFIAQNCRLNKAQKERVLKAFQFYKIDADVVKWV